MLDTTSVRKLKILQYNINKLRKKVLIGLLEDPEVALYDILVI
jgi:hypothetical protein